MKNVILENKSVGIHQPNLMPWLGYFLKVAVSDVFIIHDNVEFSKKSLTKRTFIQSSVLDIDKKYLGIPLGKHSDSSLIKDLKINHSEDWIAKSKNLLQSSYHKSTFYSQHKDWIFSLLEKGKEYKYFSEYSTFLIEEIIVFLGLESQIMISSKLPVSGQKSAYNINLVKYADGSIYNSGTGARKYQTQEEFDTANIELRYINSFAFLEQIGSEYPNFNIGYSIIDNIFHLGLDNLTEIIERYKKDYVSIHQKT